MRTPCLAHVTACLALAASLILPATSPAQSIPNPSFEANSFTLFPGYSSDNGAITDWSSSKPASTGLNPAAGSPFADNGTIPAGTNVAFLQSTVGGTDLNTTITGLTAGTAYRVSFRANARGNQNPTLKVSIGGAPVNTSVNFATAAPGGVITSVMAVNPYHYVEFEFTAAGSTAALTLVNDAAGDNTVCVDDFQITLASAPLSTGIVGARWTGDADSGIDGQYRYTRAHTFGGAAVNVTVNGVLFTPCFGANPGAANAFTSTGFGANFGEQARNISGSSNLVARSFMYGGPNTSMTFAGLKPNTTYVATLYAAGWDNVPTDRSSNFTGSAGGGPVNINVSAYGPANGMVVHYRYTTDSNGSPVLLDYPQAPSAIGSWHTAAMSNREARPGATANTWSIAPWNNDASSGINDGASYQYTHAYNLGSGASAVINGVAFTGVGGVAPFAANFSTSANWTGVFNGDANNVVDNGGSRTLANDFIYNGFPGSITLTGLTPGTAYVLTLFSVGWEAPGARVVSFQGYEQVGGVFDQDTFDNNNGIRISYAYTAPPSGTLTVTTNPMQNASFHLYGFANRKAAPDTNLAITAHPQPVFVTSAGGTAVFMASASGNLPLTYQWLKDGNPMPGETGTTNLTATLTINGVDADDVANYSCSFTGSGGQGTVTSNTARLHYIPDRVPGLFDSGVGNNGSVLPDGGEDPHYTITVNPDGPPAPAKVHDSTIFPIVTGPWLANSALSKWIAPQVNTVASQGEAVDAGAGPGVYVYRTTFHLTGYDLSTVRITGGWATDNLGVNIYVNGQPTGNTNTAQFPSLTPFTINSSNANFQTGQNTLEFHVQNQTVTPGYTGLRVEGLSGYGTINPGTAPYIATQPVNTSIAWLGSDTLTVSAGGSATLTYQWFRNGQPVPGASGASLPITADNANKAGNYTVQVTNGVNSVTSNVAVVSFTGVPLQAGAVTMSLEPGSSGKVTIASVLALATGANGAVQLAGVQTNSVQGGSVALVDGWIVYQPLPGFSGADSFEYFIEDSVTTATGTVSIAVAHDAGETFNIVGTVNEGAGKRVTSLGIPGRTYQVQSTENLTTWTDLGPPQVCPNSGVISMLDPGPLPPSRFYRTIQSP
jgi:hypothetical protein